MIGVYILRHALSRRYYIGSTGHFGDRKSKHLYLLRQGIHNCKALQEVYNANPELEWEFIQTSDREQAYRLENEMLQQHWGNPLLGNALPGVTGLGVSMPLAVRDKISVAKQGGRHTDETRALMSEQRLGKTKSPEWVDKIAESVSIRVVVDGVTYKSASAAGAALGITPNTVLARARSQKHKYSGWSIA